MTVSSTIEFMYHIRIDILKYSERFETIYVKNMEDLLGQDPSGYTSAMNRRLIADDSTLFPSLV